jgi:hypothetical protein
MTASKCAQLENIPIQAAAIGLPTKGARVTEAKWTPTGGTGSTAIAAHYLVTGEITPIDSTSQSIHFHLALPENWNSKALMLGGGGFDGFIPDVTASPGNALPTAPTPLARGYAVFAGDSGHQAKAITPGPPGPEDSAFFGNDEEYRNTSGMR